MMAQDLKRCSFCGGKAVEFLAGVTAGCSHKSCPMSEPIDIYKWQYRPIEDELQKKLDKLTMDYQSLDNRVVDCQDRMMYAAKLLEQIAEMSVTIILKDGSIINSGELASDALDRIRNG